MVQIILAAQNQLTAEHINGTRAYEYEQTRKPEVAIESRHQIEETMLRTDIWQDNTPIVRRHRILPFVQYNLGIC